MSLNAFKLLRLTGRIKNDGSDAAVIDSLWGKNKQTNKQKRRPTHLWRLQTVQENLDSRIKTHHNQHRRRRGDNEISNRKGPLSTLRAYEYQHCVCTRMSTLCVQEGQHCVYKSVNTVCARVSKLRVYKGVNTVCLQQCPNCVFTRMSKLLTSVKTACLQVSTLCVQEYQNYVCTSVNTACVQECQHCVYKCQHCVCTRVSTLCVSKKTK